jgi:hypothetical protein
MADGIDAKGIGLAVKDIVIGVAAAAVGAAGGGQAGASGVLKAGDGIDKIIGMATDGGSRGQRFDRADFAAKPQATPTAATPPAAQRGPSDRELALVHLGAMGWTPEQADKILAGPNQYRMAQIAPPQVDGQRVELAQASAVPLQEGIPVARAPGEAVPSATGTALQRVAGRRIKPDEPA